VNTSIKGAGPLASIVFFPPGTLPNGSAPGWMDEGTRIGWMTASMRPIGGPKSAQQRAKVQYARASGCEYDDMRIAPATFVASNASEYKRWQGFQSRHRDGELSWIVKPQQGYHGNGMKVHIANSSDSLTADKYLELYHQRPFMVQEYIHDALLLKGKYKFDFRVWMLLARTDPWTVYFSDGFLRRAYAPFSEGGTLAHITNSFQVDEKISKDPNFSSYNHIWNFVELHRWLKKHNKGKSSPDAFIQDQLRPYLKEVLRFVFRSTVESGGNMRKFNRPGKTHIFALDFAMDQNLKPWFLEGNGNPDLSKDWQVRSAGGFRENLQVTAKTLVVKLQTEAWSREEPPLHHGNWELLYNEASEACADRAYDPCDVFVDKNMSEIAAQWLYKSPPWPPQGAPFPIREKTELQWKKVV